MCDVREAVRLPGMINMNIEAKKLKEELDGEGSEEKTFHLNIPLQISVDTHRLNSRTVFSPGVGKMWVGNDSSEVRGRVPVEGRSRTPSTRVRSASAGRDQKQEMAARYWAVLFENLRRAVDDLYRTCEGDESCVGAKEVLMVLENYVKDFKNLINWLKLKTEYENTPLPQRPTSLAWDIRKTSPAGKLTPTGGSGKLTPTRQLLLCSPAKRQLNFDEKDGTRSRKVSETIKEAKIESDCSPVESTLDSLKLIDVEEIEIDANCSEHEKSDSEQEKDSEPAADISISVPLKVDLKLDTEEAVTNDITAEDPEEKEKPAGIKKKPETDKLSVAKVEKSSQRITGSTVRREKSEDKSKMASSKSSAAFNKTTFASTVKSMGKVLPARAAGSTPRMTRALTTISPANKPVITRRTTAGLLITSQRLQSAPVKQVHKKLETPRSPKHQRISLVARQSQFAQTNRGGGSGGRGHPSRGKPAPSSTQHTDTSVSVLPQGSSTSLNSEASARSWADTVKGRRYTLSHASMENMRRAQEDEEEEEGWSKDEEGWCTVRRARSRFSPSSSAAQGSTRSKLSSINSKAKNRFRMPSSAVSMPSLVMEEDKVEDGRREDRQDRPGIEKSASSASIVRSKDVRAPRLGSVCEKTGSSLESIPGEESRNMKKKKDLINHSKQKALKKTSDPGQTKPKSKAKKTNSAPLLVKPADITEIEAEAVVEEEKGELNANKLIKADTMILRHSPDIGQDNETDTDSEEILQRDAAIAKAELEAAHLQREIQETEQAELTDTDGDTETTDTELNYTTDTDTNDTRSEFGGGIENMFEGLSWAEQMELEDQLGDATESRYPGRAIHLHEKLSSPARKKEPHETLLHYQEKQDKARVRRQMFSEEKASKLALLSQRISEVLEQRDRLVDERKTMIDKKLKKAEEKRIQHIEGIRRKAHEEEEKLKEIAFINELQAQNTRIDMITQVSVADEKCEERLAEIAGERAKKAEQREEREARAEEKRRVLEEERQKHLDAMIEKRREREERIQGSQAAAREKRKVSARQKDIERLERLSTVRAAEKDMKEELQEKIQQKQEDAAKRHAEYLEEIRLKAFELSVQKCTSDEGVPIIKPYETKKKCEACNVLIKSEVHLQSHLRGKQHAEEINKKTEGKNLSGEEITDYNLKNIIDAPEGEADPDTIQAKERGKLVKKRAKKLKTKMAAKGAEYLKSLASPNKHLDSPNRAKIGKSVRDIEKLLNNQGKGAWPNTAVSSLERAFGEIFRSLERNSAKDRDLFYALGGFDVLEKIYSMLLECNGGNTCAIPIKSLVSAGRVLQGATDGSPVNVEFLLLSNRISVFADILRDQLTRLLPDTGTELDIEIAQGPDTDPLSQSIMQFLSCFLRNLAILKLNQQTATRLQDFVSYIVSIEIVDYISRYFQLVRDPIDSSPEVAEFILVALQFLSALTVAVQGSGSGDPSQLLSTLQWTELAGTVSLLYGMLLHQGRDTARDSALPPLPTHTLAVATETCTLLERLVRQNLGIVQTVLASEGISLEFRHIASYLLWYCQCHNQSSLLNQVINLIGYFTANHPDNQAIVQAGSQPSVLQQLANLPFQYFSQPELKNILFPTLLSCCNNNSTNTNILTRELSWKLIDDYILTQEAKESNLVQVILKKKS